MASSPGPSADPSSSPNNILTPSRKIQALLAAFDDSDSDEPANLPQRNALSQLSSVETGPRRASDGSEEDEDLLSARPSRMAARLEGKQAVAINMPAQSNGQLSILNNDPEALDILTEKPQESASTSEDELHRPAPRRRLLLKRKSNSTAPSSPAENLPQPPSPLFFPSPSTNRSAPQPSSSSSANDDTMRTDGSKFKALVEKHRKARMEKEAAEAAKKAAVEGLAKTKDSKSRKQRGSSPADDSDEGTDESHLDAVRRLTKDAKPTRKASKKALEEMKRETQRMSRNMQLAHQAQTKKKVTKESLLARFNFLAPSIAVEHGVSGTPSATASSDVGSDADVRKMHETPPTSPLREPVDFDKISAHQVGRAMIPSSPVPDDLVVEPPPLETLGLAATPETDKGKGKAASLMATPASIEIRRVTSEGPSLQGPLLEQTQVKQLDLRSRVAEMLKCQRAQAAIKDTDDLEVITKRGSKRKYAVFEQLPKRKVQETPSHLALKSLAHLHDSERNNNRSSMTQADVSNSLRKAARLQAREERQQKIDELKAKGVVIQTAEERERDQQEVEDLVERARQEAADISKREKELAKKDGTFVKDGLDDDDSDDEDFEENSEDDAIHNSEIDSDEDDGESDDAEDEAALENEEGHLVDDLADEVDSGEGEDEEESDTATAEEFEPEDAEHQTPAPRKSRVARVVIDDDDDDYVAEVVAIESPMMPQPTKTPQSLSKSARKQIPGLEMSDDLPLGLTQAFAATMADTQTQYERETQQDSLATIRDLPSPNISMAPQLIRLDSLDLVSDSQPASQTQPLNVNLFSTQPHNIPESPSLGRNIPATQFTPLQPAFEPTQDGGYMFSPFKGDRFATETPQDNGPHSTVDTVIAPADVSPIMQRKGRLQRGRVQLAESEDDDEAAPDGDKSAFEVMRLASKGTKQPLFDKSKSSARNIVDEAAEESDDEYAGLGGASDDDANDEENEDDREMIDHDTQIGKGDEAKLAGLFADRERKSDEAAVSKLLKDITTGALRRKRGANDELDLSDEEDAVARRREAKRREFAKMRRELLKDEAVGKIAEDKKKEAFLKSIEDREAVSDDDEFDEPETPLEEPQHKSQTQDDRKDTELSRPGDSRKRPLEAASESQLNRLPPSFHRKPQNQKPSTLAEIRESVSFLIEEPDSQAGTIDLGISDSEEEPEAYVNLDRHLKTAEADENAEFDDDDDLDDFIVDDDNRARDNGKPASQESTFKKPSLPSQTSRPSFAERRTDRGNVVNRLSLLRQSSSTSSNLSVKQAFYSTANNSGSSFKMPSLLRRATTSSSLSSVSSDNVSATGVTTSRTERGHVSEEKEFIRKGTGGRRNAVNYRPTVKEERMSARAGVQKAQKNKGKAVKGFLGGLFRGDSWG